MGEQGGQGSVAHMLNLEGYSEESLQGSWQLACWTKEMAFLVGKSHLQSVVITLCISEALVF